MEELYNKLKKYNLDDAIEIEESDKQFLALKSLSKNIDDINLYSFLVIVNSLVCYQLSGKGEDYWEEFSKYFSDIEINKNTITNELINFISNSKNNKRYLKTKINRIKKTAKIFEEFSGKTKYYYENLIELRNLLSEQMNQNKNAKTIVFSIKMFSYFARNFYSFKEFPKEIFIPIDSRLTKIFEKYKGNYININKFYLDLSEKLDIPMLHLDGIIWTLYDKLIKNEKM